MMLLAASDWIDLTGVGALRLALAVVLGGLIGLEREIDDQPAGLRTHLSVCLGAALFGVISTLGFGEFESARAETNLAIDVSRVASQVVVGVGFLGAGIIFRRNGHIRNLTTAASLWVTAAVGLAAGVGDGGIALVAAGMLLVALVILRVPRDYVRRKLTRATRVFRLTLAEGTAVQDVVDLLDGLPDVEVEVVGVEKLDGHVRLIIRVRSEPELTPGLGLRPLLDRPEILEVRADELGDR